jgi:FkbM family methyltransferase
MTTLTLSLHRCARQIKRLGRLVTGHDAIYRYDAKPRKLSLGTIYGGWVIAPDGFNANSVMYSFGVGNDISFDLAAIEKFGITVHGFDPSPEAIRWISEKTDLPARYIFHPYGLGPEDGDMEFYSPTTGGMYSLHEGHRWVGKTKTSLAVRSFPSILSSLGTPYVDVLKMDIEGGEYLQIDTLIENRSSIGQLLIEFHHRIGVAPLKETVNSVNRLRAAGFHLFHVSGTSSEFSFLRDTP